MHTHDEFGEIVPVREFEPNPIFRTLLRKYDPSGKVLKWKITVKPSGTISMLNSTSTGIHWQSQPLIHNRDDWIEAHERGWI